MKDTPISSTEMSYSKETYKSNQQLPFFFSLNIYKFQV